MDTAAISYTVGVSRRFGLYFRKYKVWGHSNEQVGDKVRLNLRLEDGSVLAVPDVAKRWVRVYSDYSTAMENQRELKEAQKGIPIEDLRDELSASE